MTFTTKYVPHSEPLCVCWEMDGPITRDEITTAFCYDFGTFPPTVDFTWQEDGDGIGGGPVEIDTIYVCLPAFSANGDVGPAFSITLTEMVQYFMAGCGAEEGKPIHPDERLGPGLLRDKLRSLADEIDGRLAP